MVNFSSKTTITLSLIFNIAETIIIFSHQFFLIFIFFIYNIQSQLRHFSEIYLFLILEGLIEDLHKK